MLKRVTALVLSSTFWLVLTAAGSDAAPIQRTGTFTINVNLTVSSVIPNGTVINVSPDASAIDATYNNDASAFASATVANGKAHVILKIPYTWVVASASDQVTVSLSVYGNASDATYSYNDSSYFSQTIALPTNGKTTVVTFTGSI